MAETARHARMDDGWSMSGRRERAVMEVTSATDEPAEAERRFPTTRGVLSAEEIAALLRPDLDDMATEETAADTDTIAAVKPADFTTPDVAAPAHIHCQIIAARLSLALRQDCEFDAVIKLDETQTRSFREAMTLVQPGWATVFLGNRAGMIAGALLLSPALAFAFIEASCGGRAGVQIPAGSGRTLTPVDAALLSSLLTPLAKAAGSDLRIARIETDARFAAALAPPADTTIMHLEVLSGTHSTEAILILAEDDSSATAPAATPDRDTSPRGVVATMTARIATLSVSVSRLADLKPGSTLLLGVPQDQPVQLLSGGRNGALVAEGEIGRKGGQMAIRINRRGPVLHQP